jgi:biopolymer transport protein ExbD
MAKKRKDRYGLSGEVQFQMAPLIDCVFLLLIFFISVTTFHSAETIDLQLAYAQTAEEFEKGRDTLIVNVTAAGEIRCQDRRFLTKSALQDFMQGLVDDHGTGWKVAIRGDRKAREKEIKDVYRAAALVGLTRISLVTQTREEEQKMITGRAEVVVDEDEVPEEDLIY